jgi:hypothetical protein
VAQIFEKGVFDLGGNLKPKGSQANTGNLGPQGED